MSSLKKFLPRDSGGWFLTLEPLALGLFLQPGWKGVLLGLGAYAAFFLRQPLRVLLLDVLHRRWLERTTTAFLLCLVLLLVLLLVGFVALLPTLPQARLVLFVAGVLAFVSMVFDARGKSRHLTPEILGSFAMSSLTYFVVLANGGSATIGMIACLGLLARVVTSIPFVRFRITQLKRPEAPKLRQLAIHLFSTGYVLALSIATELPLWAALLIAVAFIAQIIELFAQPRAAKVLGIHQVFVGLWIVGILAFALR